MNRQPPSFQMIQIDDHLKQVTLEPGAASEALYISVSSVVNALGGLPLSDALFVFSLATGAVAKHLATAEHEAFPGTCSEGVIPLQQAVFDALQAHPGPKCPYTAIEALSLVGVSLATMQSEAQKDEDPTPSASPARHVH